MPDLTTSTVFRFSRLELSGQARPVLLVGPPGGGKTLTAARLPRWGSPRPRPCRAQPAGRAEPGVWSIPDGDAYYAFRVKQSTTTDLTPAQIHKIGEDEVARDEVDMLVIAKKLGYAALAIDYFVDEGLPLPPGVSLAPMPVKG